MLPSDAEAGQQPMADILEKQKAHFLKSAAVPAEVREDRLDRLLSGLTMYEDKICDALMSDYGYRSPDQSRFAEVVTSHKPIKAARRNVRKWMKRERRKTSFPFNLAGAHSYVWYQPLGVVGIISPWNFPVNLTVAPLAGVLAAGNRAMIKPSELTPATAEVMADMIAGHFDPAEVSVVNGGAETGKAFSALPFDHLIYTGGENVARHIMRAAAENLVPLTLELGGKSPVIIGAGAELKLAAKQILFGKTFNAGQVCLAPDYVLLPESQLEAFTEAMKQAAVAFFPAERGVRDFVSVINNRHAERIRGYLSEAEAEGAKTIALGPWPIPGDKMQDTNIIPVAMVINPSDNCRVLKEEIFGPVLVVRTYRSIEDAIGTVNRGPKPLALYYFGKKGPEREKVEQETSSGGMTINDVIMHYTMDDLPFGGVGASGMGAYHGFDGFKQFSHARAIYRQSAFDVGRLIRPPYGRAFRQLGKFLMKTG